MSEESPETHYEFSMSVYERTGRESKRIREFAFIVADFHSATLVFNRAVAGYMNDWGFVATEKDEND